MFSRYISGKNKQHKHMKITQPFLTEINLQDGTRMVNKKMCFYLGKKHQANPPTPTDPDVKIFKPDKEMTVYVQTFGGYATQGINLKQAKKFAKRLNRVGEKVDRDHFYTASYDDPMKSTNRRNEVMFLVPISAPRWIDDFINAHNYNNYGYN